MRHERLHNRQSSKTVPAAVSHPITPESLDSTDELSPGGQAHYSSPVEERYPLASGSTPASATPDLLMPSSELNFELIWQESEDLFQTIMSGDLTTQHIFPVGTFPFDTTSPLDPSISIPSPSTSSRVESIAAIPSGGNQRAVQDVSKMISSLVSDATTL
jgi:hypothetical protein